MKVTKEAELRDAEEAASLMLLHYRQKSRKFIDKFIDGKINIPR
jgi:hypothetical protein